MLEKGSEVFIRYNEAISILQKVQAFKGVSFSTLVSSRKPFGLATNFSAFDKMQSPKRDIYLYRFGDNGYIAKEQVEKNQLWIKDFKVIVPYASPGSDVYPHQILSKPIISQPQSICTETYLVIGPFSSEQKSSNVVSYMATRFFRFLVLLIKNTQHITKNTYSFVPIQNFDETWTDEKLYTKYGITSDEIDFIESMIRPMEL